MLYFGACIFRLYITVLTMHKIGYLMLVLGYYKKRIIIKLSFFHLTNVCVLCLKQLFVLHPQQ